MSVRRIFLRRDTAANWSSENPVLSEGEPGFQTDPGNQILKVGNGTTPWNSLSQFQGPAGQDGQDGADGQDGVDGQNGANYYIPQSDGVIMAHRGYSDAYPENTIQAFEKAFEEGADGIEGDFRLTSDGEVVCIHDSTTDRTEITGLNKTVANETYATLNAGNYGTGVGDLPKLVDVLNTVPRSKIIQIELKDYSNAMVDAVKSIIDDHSIESNQVKIISFSSSALSYSKQVMPNINTFLLKNFNSDTSDATINDTIATMETNKIDGILVNKTLFLTYNNTSYIDKIKNAGFVLGAYTSNVYDDSILLQDRGVQFIATDTPNLHRDFRVKKGKSYHVSKLNNHQMDGNITTITGLGNNGATLAYFYNNEWLSAFDGSIIQSWNINSVRLTFNTGQSSNADIASDYGSAVTTTTNAHIVTGSGCPDIDLLWQLADGNPSTNVWEIHSASSFDAAFGVSKKPVAQLDVNILGGSYPANPVIKFSTTTTTAQVKIVGFRIGDASDKNDANGYVGPTAWTINIYENSTSGNKVYSQTTNALDAGDYQDIVINYMGAAGADYVMEFDDGGTDWYSTAINDLVFEQHASQTPSGDLVP